MYTSISVVAGLVVCIFLLEQLETIHPIYTSIRGIAVIAVIVYIAWLAIRFIKWIFKWCFRRLRYDMKEINPSRYLEEIVLVHSTQTYQYAIQCLQHFLLVTKSDRVLGFDCEWVNNNPVSLIQLATPHGFCAVFRIGKIRSIPRALEDILMDDSILKVGVAGDIDRQRLWKDYMVQVRAIVDLRRIADFVDAYPGPKSLAALSLYYLGIEMDKSIQIRCGNWDANILTNRQIDYAARDALISVLVYQELKERGESNGLWEHLDKGVADLRYRDYYL